MGEAGVSKLAAQASARDALWVAQRGGNGVPLAFVVAGYGDAWVAKGLAHSLGPEHAVYVLQPPRSEISAATSARELAALYVRLLREQQPRGPYCLSGYSAGAVLALEMAQQLLALREEVRTLALLDPLFVSYTRFELWSYNVLQRICRLIKPLVPGKLRLIQILTAMFQDRGLDAHLAALTGYRPSRYAGEITLYQSRWGIWRSPLLVARWKRIAAGKLKRVSVTGNHHSFIRSPHVAELARRIRASMERAAD